MNFPVLKTDAADLVSDQEGGAWYPPRNKFKTAIEIVKLVRNWPDALELRLWKNRRSLRLLEFRNGLNVIIRGGSNEWSVVHEVLFVGGYQKALKWLADRPESAPVVMDLGANIGIFSMLAARANPTARVFSYEPGPPNIRINLMNMLANPDLAARIELTEAAIGGTSGEAHWNFDSENPGGSSLANGGSRTGDLVKVSLVAFADAVAKLPGDIALVKMDIEGSEWDVLARTPKETWDRVQSVALELHDDPAGRQTWNDFLNRLASYGFKIERESVITYFLHR